jgi:hypothetical protein
MLGNLETFQLECDAPSYCIVRISQILGFESPLDVRWCRLRHFLGSQSERQSLWSRLWNFFIGRTEPKRKTCTCGRLLPDMKRLALAHLFPQEGNYFLGQCPRCRTIFWEKEAAFSHTRLLDD